MINRRNFLLASLASVMMPRAVTAGMRTDRMLSWADFQVGMKQLASAYANRSISQTDVAARGVRLLQQVDIAGSEFIAAVNASYESGNPYWLWQRLARESSINGGLLTIEKNQDVPLHDHPGATGMVRILSGKVEVWQFDRSAEVSKTEGLAVLERVTHRVMRPGDIAILSPDRANIHALRARTRECSMLDYFIPPYGRSERTWYQPMDNAWREELRISCRPVAENDFYMS